ncbi:MAG: hypothetical protein LBB48_10295 [Treponema sp.]|jgi:hypothetical protein|nr:hypothetical protein [Treponema sp.]
MGRIRKGRAASIWPLTRRLFFCVFAHLCLFSCATPEKPTAQLHWSPPPAPPPPIQTVSVVSQKSNVFPGWVQAYLTGGLRGVERLSAYRTAYVFIKEIKGNNDTAITQWALHFSVERELPRMVAARVQNRLERNVKTYPDYEYGVFFENAIKVFSNARYERAVKLDDFWFERLISVENGVEVNRREFLFLIMVAIEKNTLVDQINAIFPTIPLVPEPTRAQLNAISHVKSAFFTGF